jgi:mannose PTS system EIIA component
MPLPQTGFWKAATNRWLNEARYAHPSMIFTARLNMTGLLIVAHNPLASALQSVAAHTNPEGACRLQTVDVLAHMPAEEVERLLRAALKQINQPQALVLCDVVGATPYNVALRLADGDHVRVVAGVNVAMLLRCMTYSAKPLNELLEIALAGGVRGVMTPPI